MQKNNKEASILIWSIFLSLILSISFVGISSKISKQLQQNQNYLNKNTGTEFLKNKLKKKDYSDENLPNNENIVFIQNKDFYGTLKKEENIKIKLVENSDISINIINGGPIFYITSGNLTSSGIIISNIGLTLSGNIILNNLGGYTKYSLISNKNIVPPEIIYKVMKKIGNKNIIKTSGIIK